MISTGGSITGAARVVKEKGARKVVVAATHGVLCGPAIERLQAAPIDQIFLTDTIPLRPEQKLDKIQVVSVAKTLADAITCIHENRSISQMLAKLGNSGRYF